MSSITIWSDILARVKKALIKECNKKILAQQQFEHEITNANVIFEQPKPCEAMVTRFESSVSR